MEIKIKKLHESASVGSVASNFIGLNCFDILTEVGKDGRLVLIYRSGLSIEIPEGHIGILVPTKLAPIYSLEDAGGLQVFNAGYKGELIGRYKISTNSVPAVFEKEEEFARLMIIETAKLDITIEEAENENQGVVEDEQVKSESENESRQAEDTVSE